MYKGKIIDHRIRLCASKELLELITAHADVITEMPANVAKLLKAAGYEVPVKVELLSDEVTFKQPKIDFELLQKLPEVEATKQAAVEKKQEEQQVKQTDTATTTNYLFLQDLRWLNQFLAQLRSDRNVQVYLHQFLSKSDLLLPENELIERNAELEERCQKLRVEQQNREYKNMTKNVDAATKNLPEDTIAYQMKVLNKQIIAVLQFIMSVVAGFVFGFLGIQLIFGNLEFGFRLLLGIICALIIALAEIYFLAKKLNEYDEVTTTQESFPNTMKFKKKE